MIFSTIKFDVKDRVYFKMLKSYILLNYSNVIKIDDINYDFVISDKVKLKENYIIINDTNFDIYKYQKASKICSQIVNKTNKNKKDDKTLPTINKVKIITVTSAIGGAGKTTIAEAIASILVSEGHKILLISLDLFSPYAGLLEDVNENDISKLIYYLQEERGVNISIEACKSYDHNKDIYFIRSIYPSLDGFISEKVTSSLLKGIKNNRIYDYIVFDIPSYLTKGNIKIMNEANLNILIKLNDSRREKIYIEYLEKKTKKTITIINRESNIRKILKV